MRPSHTPSVPPSTGSVFHCTTVRLCTARRGSPSGCEPFPKGRWSPRGAPGCCSRDRVKAAAIQSGRCTGGRDGVGRRADTVDAPVAWECTHNQCTGLGKVQCMSNPAVSVVSVMAVSGQCTSEHSPWPLSSSCRCRVSLLVFLRTQQAGVCLACASMLSPLLAGEERTRVVRLLVTHGVGKESAVRAAVDGSCWS